MGQKDVDILSMQDQPAKGEWREIPGTEDIDYLRKEARDYGESISMSFDEVEDAPTRKSGGNPFFSLRGGRSGQVSGSDSKSKPRGKAAPKPTATQKKVSGSKVAQQLCDGVGLLAAWLLRTPDAAMTTDERDAIQQPLSNILARFDAITKVETGSEAGSLVVASAFYGFRLYTLYNMQRDAAKHPQRNTGGQSAPTTPTTPHQGGGVDLTPNNVSTPADGPAVPSLTDIFAMMGEAQPPTGIMIPDMIPNRADNPNGVAPRPPRSQSPIVPGA